MRTYLLSILLLIAVVSSAIGQITYDFKTAKALALSGNKLIIIDFWAPWCGPCKAMDRDLWNTASFAKLTDRFVLLKINTDSNKDIAARYGVRGIPRVFVITVNGDRIWDETGFRGAASYLDMLSAFPKDYAALSRGLAEISDKKKDKAKGLFHVGEAFRELALETDNGSIKGAFFSLSSSYFKKAQKKADSGMLEMKSLLSQILNDAYKGSHKKAMKKLEKIKLKDDSPEKLKEFKSFVMAYCYKCEGDLKKLEALKKGIRDKELLARLE